MQITIGWACLILGAFLYIAQLISSIDFKLAQQLGIQENPEETDSILQTAERYTALWDLVTPVSYTHLTLPTNVQQCRSRWSPYH